eukprot:gene17717-21124_t
MSASGYGLGEVYRIDNNSPTVTGSCNNIGDSFTLQGKVTGDYIMDDPSYVYFVRASIMLGDISLAAAYYVNMVTHSLPYPFGYTSRLVNGSVTFEATIPVYANTSNSIIASINQQYQIPSLQIVLDTPLAKVTPSIHSITMRAFSSYSYIVRINVTDPVGFNRISWDGYDGNALKSGSIIIDGDQYSGIFEFEISTIYYVAMPLQNPSLSIENLDFRGGKFKISYYAPYNLAGDFIPPVPTNLLKFGLLDITHLEFKTPTVDLLDRPFENTLFFNITNLDKTAKPKFIINDLVEPSTIDSNNTFYGQYDPTRDMYRIDFIIPKQQMVGYIPFYLVNFIPMIMEISQFPASPVNVQPTEKIMIGWNLTIEDYPNSFKSGEALIISGLDNEAIVINFNSSNLVSGDRFRDDAGDMTLSKSFMGIQPIIGGVYDIMRRFNIICP